MTEGLERVTQPPHDRIVTVVYAITVLAGVILTVSLLMAMASMVEQLP